MSETDRKKWNQRYTAGAYADRLHPSEFLLEALAIADFEPDQQWRALDVACGAGRNALYLAQMGFAVDAVDVSCVALARAEAKSSAAGLRVNWMQMDLDQPLSVSGDYDLIVMIRYVNVRLLGELATRLRPGGWLVCEEHANLSSAEMEGVIGPSNPTYRVAPNALATACANLDIRHCSEARVQDPDARCAALARILARAPVPEM